MPRRKPGQNIGVKIELDKRDVTYVQIAKKLKVTPQHVKEVVFGNRSSARVEAAIEKIIGRPPREVLAEFEAQAAA